MIEVVVLRHMQIAYVSLLSAADLDGEINRNQGFKITLEGCRKLLVSKAGPATDAVCPSENGDHWMRRFVDRSVSGRCFSYETCIRCGHRPNRILTEWHEEVPA